MRVAGVLENNDNYIKINSSICIEHELHKSASLNIRSLCCSLHINEHGLSSSQCMLLNSGILITNGFCYVMIMRSHILREIIIKLLCRDLGLPSCFLPTLFAGSCNF